MAKGCQARSGTCRQPFLARSWVTKPRIDLHTRRARRLLGKGEGGKPQKLADAEAEDPAGQHFDELQKIANAVGKPPETQFRIDGVRSPWELGCELNSAVSQAAHSEYLSLWSSP